MKINRNFLRFSDATLGLLTCLAFSMIGGLRDYIYLSSEGRTILQIILPSFLNFFSIIIVWLVIFTQLEPFKTGNKLYTKKAISKTFLTAIIANFPFVVFAYYVEMHYLDKVEGITSLHFIGIYCLRFVLLFCFILLFKFLIDSDKMAKHYYSEAERLREANDKAQFEILRQQINPHFLFNALSTLKSLIRLQDPNAENFVMSLSDVYRKLLQRRDRELIYLEDELEIVNSYLFMQKMRFENNLFTEINIASEHLKSYIPPFALQLLVENSIKHNIISRKKPLTIKIYSDEKKNIIVENNHQSKSVPDEESTGWGLKNLNERYSAFCDCKIMVNEKDDVFQVVLPILNFEKV